MSPIKGISTLSFLGRELGFTGNKASKRFVWRVCSTCKQGAWVRQDSFRKICQICNAKRMAQNHEQRGNQNPNWKGGRIRNQGYILIHLQPDDPYYSMAKKSGYVLEHRLVTAKQLGRCLTPGEKVHHINGNKELNLPTNLEITTSKQHKLSYTDGYNQGYKDGQKVRLSELMQEIRLLRLQVKGLRDQMQSSFLKEEI